MLFKGDGEDFEPVGLETRCVGSRDFRAELIVGLNGEVRTTLCNDAAVEACDWRIAPHAYGDRGKDPQHNLNEGVVEQRNAELHADTVEA